MNKLVFGSLELGFVEIGAEVDFWEVDVGFVLVEVPFVEVDVNCLNEVVLGTVARKSKRPALFTRSGGVEAAGRNGISLMTSRSSSGASRRLRL